MDKKNDKKLGGCTGNGFKPGTSGNPGGKPKTTELRLLLNKIVNSRVVSSNIVLEYNGKKEEIKTVIRSKRKDRTILEEILIVQVIKALKGERKSAQVILDRLYGKPPIAVDIKDDNKGELIEAIQRLVENSPDQ